MSTVHPWETETDWRNELRGTRDLIGEPAHLIAAIFALVMQVLGSAPASIGFVTLVVAGALRSPVLLPVWWRMLSFTWVKLLLLWLAWSAISLAWSPDLAAGVDRLSGLKYLAWIPLLWPLHRQWKWLLGGFLFATLVLQGIQISGAVFGKSYKDKSLARGLNHPTMAGMWDAVALSCWLFLSVAAGWRVRLLSLSMAVLSSFGFFWAGQRAPFVGVVVGVAASSVVLASIGKMKLRRAIIGGMVGVVILGSALLVSQTGLRESFVELAQESTQSLRGDAPVITEPRIGMWMLALTAWREQPICGVGLGGYQRATVNIPLSHGQHDPHVHKTPHSIYITTLTESGIIGLALLLAWSAAFFVRGVACLRLEPIRIGVFGGAIIWFTAAAFDTLTANGALFGVGVIMIAMTVMPPISGSRRTRASRRAMCATFLSRPEP